MFLLSVWMSNSTFTAGQCLNASQSNDSHGVMLCHVKGTSVKPISFQFHYLWLFFLCLWKTCWHETSSKTYLSVRDQFHTKVQILILKPCSLEALTLHEKWHMVYKNVHYGFFLQLQEEEKYRELQRVPLTDAYSVDLGHWFFSFSLSLFLLTGTI